MHTYEGWWEFVLDMRALEKTCFLFFYFYEDFDFSVCQLALLFQSFKGHFVVFLLHGGDTFNIAFLNTGFCL